MRKLTAIVVASSLALGSAGLAYAENAPKPPAPEGHMMKHQGPRGMEHELIFKGLNLTDAQKQQMRQIIDDSHKEGRKQAFNPDERRALHALIAADSFDRAKAEAEVDRVSENSKARLLARLEMQNKLYNILTPEQKKQFNDNFEKRLNKPPREDRKPPAPEQ